MTTNDTDLRGAVAKRDPGSHPPPVPATGTAMEAFGAPDQAQILASIGLNPADPRAHAVVAVAERYGLDPVLGHIVILPKSSRPYITRDGYNHIAVASRQLDGIEVIDGPRRDQQEREWVCKVAVYRKDMSRPFTYPGRAALSLDNGPEMAIARAERRALKRAFNVTLPREFADDDTDTRPLDAGQPPDPAPGLSPRSPAAPPAAAGSEPIGQHQLTAVQAGFTDAGITDRDERLAMLSEWTGRTITTAKELTADDAAEVLSRLAERREDGAVDAEVVQDPEPPGDGDSEPDDPPATKQQRAAVLAALKHAGVTRKADVLYRLSDWTGRDITATTDLLESEAADAAEQARHLTTVPEDPEEYP